MSKSVEAAHKRISEKFAKLKQAADTTVSIISDYKTAIITEGASRVEEFVGSRVPETNSREPLTALNNIKMNLFISEIDELEDEYKLSSASALYEYFSNENAENCNEYFRIITSENFMARLDEYIGRLRSILSIISGTGHDINRVGTACTKTKESKKVWSPVDDKIRYVADIIDSANNLVVENNLEKDDYSTCNKCNIKMAVVPEYSELRCSGCSFIKRIEGAVFRDDQFYPQEGHKTKHGSYNPSRHHKFWMERLQAIESKTFDESVLSKIEYCITRDKLKKYQITCRVMRDILKECKLTRLNDHIPLLVKMFGGIPPPQLTFQENIRIGIKFSRIMEILERCKGEGNRPYYPYFIYKIIESDFASNPEKLRLLDYIHLQSSETVIKNDILYRKICELADPEDGLVFKPTVL